MTIEQEDFKLIPTGETFYDLWLRKTDKEGNLLDSYNKLYGVPLDSALERIARYRLSIKYDTITIGEYIKEYKSMLEEITKLCNHE